MMASGRYYIGLMSGTSLDGVDGVLVRWHEPQTPDRSMGSLEAGWGGAGTQAAMQVLAHAARPFEADLRAQLLALNTRGGCDELHRAALAANAIARVYAQVVGDLLAHTGLQSAQIAALGAHGQTLRHQPGLHDGCGYTLQILNAALLAELTGVGVVADMRSRDVAAGGQGAPLVPAFHQWVFGAGNGQKVFVLNIGGISNISILNGENGALGFDCGPGNALMDWWCAQYTGQNFDDNGQWAAGGNILPDLLHILMQEPFLHQKPPKSTGRDLFNPAWLMEQLKCAGFENIKNISPNTARDIQATLTAFTARACALAVADFVDEHCDAAPLLVCGGGALNGCLMQRLQQELPKLRVMSSAQRGLPPLQVEAAAFAWLARQFQQGAAGNLPAVTGARGPRVLGAWYPA